jgi:protocatechuate 3,4-dioxygenase beta subunit
MIELSGLSALWKPDLIDFFGEAPMRNISRSPILLGLALACVLSLRATCFAQGSESGSIAGKVLLDGKPAPGVTVVATPDSSNPARMFERMLKPSSAPRATTDSDGRYRIEGLRAGKYDVAVSSRVLVSAGGSGHDEVTVTDGAVEGIDFSLLRGGVITGKITDSEGRPVINERVSVKNGVLTEGNLAFYTSMGNRMYYTDDRGVYRVFGLQPGKYIVSAGGSQDPFSGMLLKRRANARAYYPGVPDEARARAVELAEGAEVTGIDIKLGTIEKGVVISGRIIDADTRTPIADAMIAYAKVIPPASANDDNDDEKDDEKDEDLGRGMPGGFTTTNARGEFRFESVAPGKYRLEANSIAAFADAGGFYADPLDFEVHYANIDKLELKIHRGASISGVVVVENADRPDVASDLPGFMLMASAPGTQSRPFSQTVTRVSPDLSFRIGGLRAGKVRLGGIPYAQQRFSVLRIERNGLPVTDGFDIQGNEQIAGVRIILVEANCVLRGRVSVQSGSIPRDGFIVVNVRLVNEGGDSNQGSQVNSKGEFSFENLAPGNYEVTASLTGPNQKRRVATTQTVSVMSGIPADVALTLDLKAKDEDK